MGPCYSLSPGQREVATQLLVNWRVYGRLGGGTTRTEEPCREGSARQDLPVLRLPAAGR